MRRTLRYVDSQWQHQTTPWFSESRSKRILQQVRLLPPKHCSHPPTIVFHEVTGPGGGCVRRAASLVGCRTTFRLGTRQEVCSRMFRMTLTFVVGYAAIEYGTWPLSLSGNAFAAQLSDAGTAAKLISTMVSITRFRKAEDTSQSLTTVYQSSSWTIGSAVTYGGFPKRASSIVASCCCCSTYQVCLPISWSTIGDWTVDAGVRLEPYCSQARSLDGLCKHSSTMNQSLTRPRPSKFRS